MCVHVCVCVRACVCACARSVVSVCDSLDWSPPGSSIRGIFQTRILGWVAISLSRASSWPRDRAQVSCISCTGRWILYHHTPWEALSIAIQVVNHVALISNNKLRIFKSDMLFYILEYVIHKTTILFKKFSYTVFCKKESFCLYITQMCLISTKYSVKYRTFNSYVQYVQTKEIFLYFYHLSICLCIYLKQYIW